jgi:CheY-like chemotaxis protein
MEYAYFPVPMEDLGARLDFEELAETDFYLGDIHIRTHYLNHTAPCIGYRIEVGGVVLVYATDHEPHATPLWRPDRPQGSFEAEGLLHLSDVGHVQFLRGADLVIHDTQYTEQEYPQKVGWGHATIEYARDVALTGRVKRLALFHHDPTRTDDELDRLLDAAREYAEGTGIPIHIFAAAEGAELELEEVQTGRGESREPQAPQIRARARVLVADDDEVILGTLEAALRLDGYEVVKAINGAEAVRLAGEYPFDLILLDVEMPEMDGLTACRTLRADPRFQATPIVIISALNRAEHVMAGFAEGVTDYMTKPFALSQVRARVRAWLMRAAGARGPEAGGGDKRNARRSRVRRLGPD